MKTRAAVIREAASKESPKQYEVIEVEMDEPRQGEILVRMAASGLCHTDDHLATGDVVVATYPIIGGHEGAGVVERIGPNTPGFELGDHVIFSTTPVCGRCRWCASGLQNLCNLGAAAMTGSRPEDPGSYRAHLEDGSDVAQLCCIGTFAEHTTVSAVQSVIIERDLPLDKVCLIGCCTGTGWGSAVNSAEVRPGDTVLVIGVGGVGISAVQGAVHAGATNVIAVDPLAFKRKSALDLGATHAYENLNDAIDYARSQTDGQGADSAILTVGVVSGRLVADAFAGIRKAGTLVVTSMSQWHRGRAPLAFRAHRLPETHPGDPVGWWEPHLLHPAADPALSGRAAEVG